MKILYLLQELPYPPSEGIRLKAFNVLEYMVQSHKCDILAFGDHTAQEKTRALRQLLPKVGFVRTFSAPAGPRLTLSRLWNTTIHLSPPSFARFRSEGLSQTLRALVREKHYDVVHYDVINMAQYLPAGRGTASVHSANDVTSLRCAGEAEESPNPLLRLIRLASARLLTRFERRMYPQFTKVHVVSEVEASALRTICQDADVEVIAPAVDHQFVQHGGHPRATTRSSPYRLLFTGSVAIPGILNGLTTFLGGAYLGVRAEVPNVDMRVLARNASDGVLRMLSTFPNVTATSWVEDYVTEMASADVVVFPERGGSGIRHRVLQAMALGKAVIGSPEALSGIAASSGVDCIIAHSQPDFAKGLVKLLCDPEARKGIGDSARQLVLREYTLDTIGPRWLALYERATQKFCSTNPRTAIS